MASVATCSPAGSARRPAVLPTDAKRYHNRRDALSLVRQPESLRTVRLQISYASEFFRAGDWQITDQVYMRVTQLV
jgi:hypothetical protein